MATSSASRSDSPEDSSFVKMDEKDPTLIGAHCQYTYCNQLDFLPFRCESCRGTFCLDHRSETGHKCPKAGEWASRRRKANLSTPSLGAGKNMAEAEKPCASPKCKTVIGTSLSTSVHCSTCNRDYCLKHRLKEDHDCKNLVPVGARVGIFDGEAEKARQAFSRLRAWGTAQKASVQRSLPKPKPTTAAVRLVAVNNLKKTAKGDAKIPPEKRVYMTVEAEAATTTSKFPSGGFFYNKDWVIGRVLDAAAKSLQVQNVNNQSTDEKEKLRVFHVEGGRLLEFNEKVGDAVVSGNRIVLLRGVGPAIPNLIQA
jgi:predicted nucleic acid binding AN1-type Zn finger protein